MIAGEIMTMRRYILIVDISFNRLIIKQHLIENNKETQGQ